MIALLPLRSLAHAGARTAGSAIVVVLALRDPSYWHVVRDAATPPRVLAWFGAFRPARVVRRELSGLVAFHFVLEGTAGAGRGHDLAFDEEGRALAERLLDMPVSVPAELAAKVSPSSPPPPP